MGFLDYTIRILGLSEAILKWQGAITQLSTERREKVAQYAEQVDQGQEMAKDKLGGLTGDQPEQSA